MPFVQRINAVVCGTYAILQPGFADEFLPDSSAEVIAFRNPPPDPRKVLDAAECDAAKIDGQIVAFLNMTPIELDAWVTANIIGVGPQTALKILGRLTQNAARGKPLR